MAESHAYAASLLESSAIQKCVACLESLSVAKPPKTYPPPANVDGVAETLIKVKHNKVLLDHLYYPVNIIQIELNFDRSEIENDAILKTRNLFSFYRWIGC